MPFQSRFNVTSLNGTNGFMFIDNSGDYWFGKAAANLGDVNNDSNPDLLVSALSNQAYVLFGAKHFPTRMYTSSLNGTNGFMLIGESQVKEFECIAGLGDINMDYIDDFIIGSREIPEAFVIFGGTSFPSRISLANLDGTNGFKIIGTGYGFYTASGIGDINSDGKFDFIISNTEQPLNAGGSYVIYGARKFPAILNVSSDLDGNNGFTIISERVYAGPVLAAGVNDFNGDKKSDFATGVLFDPDNVYHIIYGADRFPPVLYTSSLNGTDGFDIIKMSDSNHGSIAKIDDINGDLLSDLSVGYSISNDVYIIFGANHFNATLDASKLDGLNGVKIVGPFSESGFGFAIADTGSIDHSGKSGIIVGAPQTGLNGQTGSAYVFFGSDHFPPELYTSDLNGTNGFEIVGPLNAGLGYSVAGIDNFNGDGKPAMVVGAVLENTVYVIFDASV